MAFGISKSKQSPIGIDFGADTVKMLQVVPGDTPELVALGAATVPEEARLDLGARRAFLAEAVPDLLSKHGFKGRRVMLAIPAFQTLIHNLQIPKSSPDDMDQLVNMTLRERLGVEPSRMVIRNFATTEVIRDGVAKQEVITLAAGRDVVMKYVDLAKYCKLEVVGTHSEPPCLLRAFDHTLDQGDNSPAIAFIDIGAATTKLIFAQGRRMVLAKTIMAGGDQLTRKLADDNSMEFAEARLARFAEASGGTATVAAPTTSRTREDSPHCETLDCMIDELRLAVRHYDSRYPDRPIEKLVFVGGEAMQTQICKELARSVRIAAQLGDPFARVSRINASPSAMGVDLSRPQPGWSTVLGLCLSEANL